MAKALFFLRAAPGAAGSPHLTIVYQQELFAKIPDVAWMHDSSIVRKLKCLKA